MTDKELLKLAQSEGFHAALLSPAQIPVDPKFRTYCEDNLCGYYGSNLSCPPDCGTAEELHQRILQEEKVLIVQTCWDIEGYENKAVIKEARDTHNQMVRHLKSVMEQYGFSGFCSGYNGCSLCSPCKKQADQPCAFPDLQMSCMSAYCIDAAKLADLCRFAFAWSTTQLYLFGMIAFHSKETA